MITGYTTGVFDLFHIGHLNLLMNAKRQCEELIVGVSTDKLVFSYKHKFPIIPDHQRVKIVRALKYVDAAFLVQSRCKFEGWKRFTFDIIFVGSDWKGKSAWIEWEKKLSNVGAKVVYLPYTKDQSSSKIIEKIRG